MNKSRWGPGGPPPEAYSRVTNPERFAPLHKFAAELLHRLESTFDVERAEGYGLDPELESGKLERPSIRLVPRDSGDAPIVVTFSAFPGVRVRFGYWSTDAFPGCGCDAGDETSQSEAERLDQMVDDVTMGRFREGIQLPVAGYAWQTREFWSTAGRSQGQGRLERARELLAKADRSSYQWGPWPRR